MHGVRREVARCPEQRIAAILNTTLDANYHHRPRQLSCGHNWLDSSRTTLERII